MSELIEKNSFLLIDMRSRRSKIKDRINLPIDNYVKLLDIFKEKGWEIKSGANARYSKHLELLKQLLPEEQSLFLELTRRFQYYGLDKYSEGLHMALTSLLREAQEGSVYYVLPVMNREEYEKQETKSSHWVQYLFKGDAIQEHVDMHGTSFRVGSFKTLRNRKLRELEHILLVDDFVGTGNSVDEAFLLYAGDDSSIVKSDIVVLSLLAHEQGISHLAEQDIPFFYAQKVDRGISDYYSGEDLLRNTSIMERIESRIVDLKDECRFGYGRCEALLHMYRIPNNTFPVFWCWKGVSPYHR